MTIDQIEALFPIRVYVDRALIKKSRPFNALRCAGALTLKKALSKKVSSLSGLRISWGIITGYIHSENGAPIRIGSTDDLNFIDVSKPQWVTLKVEPW